MEGFSSLFEAVIQEKPFYYHPRCCSLGMSHIIFAHDLFVLAGATPRYLTAIKADLVEFEELSGLGLICRKVIYFLQGLMKQKEVSFVISWEYKRGDFLLGT